MENMENEMEKLEKAREMGYLYGTALNDIENGDNEAALSIAEQLREYGYSIQAQQIIDKSTTTEPGIKEKCVHGSTKDRTLKEHVDKFGYWGITEIYCEHCGDILDTERKYIRTIPEPETEPEPETPEDKSSEMITPQQSKYWYSIAKKDISEGNIDGAQNVLKWLRENNAIRHANLLEKAISEIEPETEPVIETETISEPEPEPETISEPEPEPETIPEPEPETEPETEPTYPEGKLKTTINKKLFKAWVGPMSALTDEIKFNITKTGISVKLVDPAHVAMLSTEINKKAFEEYKASDFELGIDLEKIATNLKKGSQKKDAVMSLEYDQDKGKLILANGVSERTMAIIDTAGMSDPKVPTLNLPNTVTLDTKTFLDAVKECGEVSDYARLTTDPDGFTIDSEGDTDNAKTHIPRELLNELNAREQTISLFTLDYLESAVKAIKADTITLTMGTDYPICIEWNLDNIKGKYLIAPRIESE